jgi:aspartate/methionine/tyrosine aminotransferase
VYGVSGLRCGWILAEPSLVQNMWRLIDLHYSSHVFIAEQLSVAVFSQLEMIAKRSESLLRTNCAEMRAFLESRSDISAIPPEQGLIAFPRLLAADVNRFCRILRDKYDTAVVPGKFFEMPEYVRIGLGGESAILKQGLASVARALDEFARFM